MKIIISRRVDNSTHLEIALIQHVDSICGLMKIRLYDAANILRNSYCI